MSQRGASSAAAQASTPALPLLRPGVEAYLAGLGGSRADAARHRAAIMATARELMQGPAVHSVTMKEIASRLGIGQGTLYRKFPTKAHLAGAIVSEDLLQVEDELQRHHARGAPAPALLRWFVARMVRFSLDRANLIAASMTKENMPPGWYEHTPPVQWISAVLAHLFAAGGVTGDAAGGRQLAGLLVPHFLFPGDVSGRAARRAYAARVEHLLHRLGA